MRDAAIDEAARASEVVLWFEHDLFDQLNLIWLLDALAGAGTPEQRVRLVVIGEHPEVNPFHGLGQLSPAQLLALFPGPSAPDLRGTRRGAGGIGRCLRPRSAAPRPARHVAHARLPWLPGALRRLVEELPSVSGGLSRTEQQGLEAIGRGRPDTGRRVCRRARRAKSACFWGTGVSTQSCGGYTMAATPLITRTIGSDEPPGCGAFQFRRH